MNGDLVRTTRSRIIHLRNDYKVLMGEIENGLHAHHAKLRASGAAAPIPLRGALNQRSRLNAVDEPFATVNSVVAGSPASEAGLRAGDLIAHFGSADGMNNDKLGQVAAVVQEHEGVRTLLPIPLFYFF